jgi:predicted enzyme related to lactoylglutathione lyase
MTTVTKHDPGEFCWIELATSDQKAARRFYGELFGWTAEEMPMPDGVYVMLSKDDRKVGAMYETSKMPPHWLPYIAVASADETTARAKELGANVMQGAFDVMDAGRMSVVADPEGAVFATWQANKHIGIQVARESGVLCWCELSTRNADAARQFYGSVFGYKTKVSPEYTELHVGEMPVGGILPMHEHMKDVPPHWLSYICVDDCDASAAKAQSLGAGTLVAPMDIEKVGRFSVLRDPQGAVFAVFQPKM